MSNLVPVLGSFWACLAPYAVAFVASVFVVFMAERFQQSSEG